MAKIEEVRVSRLDKKEVDAVRHAIEEIKKNVQVRKSFADIVKEELEASKPKPDVLADKASEWKLRIEILHDADSMSNVALDPTEVSSLLSTKQISSIT